MATCKPLPSQDYLRECFEYDASSSTLMWRHRPSGHFRHTPARSAETTAKIWNLRWAGKSAFARSNGYYNIGLDYQKYRAHRIIWKLVYGFDPIGVDHINGNGFDNALPNLREADQSENARNTARRRDNTSGVTGVYRDASRGKWLATIQRDGKAISLGRFALKHEAISARKLAERAFGFHENHGRERIVSIEGASE